MDRNYNQQPELVRPEFARAFQALSNPKSLPDRIVSALVSADRCANCLGNLDTGWECNQCGYDWKPWIEASKERNERAHNNREG